MAACASPLRGTEENRPSTHRVSDGQSGRERNSRKPSCPNDSTPATAHVISPPRMSPPRSRVPDSSSCVRRPTHCPAADRSARESFVVRRATRSSADNARTARIVSRVPHCASNTAHVSLRWNHRATSAAVGQRRPRPYVPSLDRSRCRAMRSGIQMSRKSSPRSPRSVVDARSSRSWSCATPSQSACTGSFDPPPVPAHGFSTPRVNPPSRAPR